MITQSALRASTVAHAMLQCSAWSMLSFPQPERTYLRWHFFPYLLWYQFETPPSLWCQPGLSVPHCSRAEGNGPEQHLASLLRSLSDRPTILTLSNGAGQSLLAFYFLVKFFHSLMYQVALMQPGINSFAKGTVWQVGHQLNGS